MIKKITWILFIIILAAAAGLYLYIFRPATGFEEKTKYFYIASDSATKADVLASLEKNRVITRPGAFERFAGWFDYWESIKPGRYEIKKGMNVPQIVRLLKSGKQSPVKLVINKYRTREDFSRFAGRMLECDSLELVQFLNSNDSLRNYGLDTNTAMTMVIPNTYSMFWNTSASRFFKRMYTESQTFWSEERKSKAKDLGLTEHEVYILASIIEEESNKNDEKPRIASVYLNRLNKRMHLGADPTVKFALRDFGIKRILFKHISESANNPYNTYRNYGLPPGPICTPSIKTIDAVLNAEKTDFLFFCARADFSGYHAFASNEKDHFKNARAYQKALDSLRIK